VVRTGPALPVVPRTKALYLLQLLAEEQLDVIWPRLVEVVEPSQRLDLSRLP
jgi:hypothetical protein